MRTFDDLIFKPHSVSIGGIQAIMKLKNGYEISVVGGGRGLYGDGKKTFEIAVFDRQGEMISFNFANWLNDSYEPCRKRQWKIRYPKNSEEMKECFTTEYLFDEYIKKMVE